jgi:hypothetical protein
MDRIERVSHMLTSAGYERTATAFGGDSSGPRAHRVEVWAGPGPNVLVHILSDGNGGFDVYAPVSDSLSIDDTLRALVERIAAKEAPK